MSRVLFTLPWWLFLAEDELAPEERAPTLATAAGIRGLMKSLPAETRFLVLAHESAVDVHGRAFQPVERLATWLSVDGLSGRTEVVAAPETVRFTIWAEDAMR